MKLAKRVTAILLVVLMAALCVVPTFAASSRYKTYSVVGDSIAAGFLLPGYKFGGKNKAAWNLIKNSYPWHIAKGIGAGKVYQMSHGGYRTSDVRLILDDNYRGDFINGRRLPSQPHTWVIDEKAMQKLRKEFRSNIARSDLITVNLGSNDSIQAFSVLSELSKKNVSILQAQAQMGLDPLTNLGETLANVIQLTSNNIMMSRLAKLEADAFLNFSSNFDAIIREIRTLNPHAKIVVLGIYNPMGDNPSGALCRPIVDFFNNYMSKGSTERDEYTFVDLPGIETNASIGDYDANPEMKLDAHPTLRGHRQIANRVLAVL